MHHGSLTNPRTVAHKVYKILTAPERMGKRQSPLLILKVLRDDYDTVVTALSTYISSVRLQLRENFPEWGEELQGPRDAVPTEEEREILGRGNFYRVVKLVKQEPTLWGDEGLE